jgi:hypothetical protein
MLKLYKIETNATLNGTFATNCSPGVTYVIAPSMDMAHVALINSYKNELDNGSIQLSELDINNLTIIANETTELFTPNTYRLVDYRNINNSNDSVTPVEGDIK